MFMLSTTFNLLTSRLLGFNLPGIGLCKYRRLAFQGTLMWRVPFMKTYLSVYGVLQEILTPSYLMTLPCMHPLFYVFPLFWVLILNINLQNLPQLLTPFFLALQCPRGTLNSRTHARTPPPHTRTHAPTHTHTHHSLMKNGPITTNLFQDSRRTLVGPGSKTSINSPRMNNINLQFE